MTPWTQAVLVLCAVAVTAALVPALLALRRAAHRAAAVLGIVEQELRPLVGQAHGLTEELRDLVREARLEVKRLGDVTEQLNRVAEGLGRIVGALGGLTRLGQVVGLAAGLRKGVNIFLHRLRKP